MNIVCGEEISEYWIIILQSPRWILINFQVFIRREAGEAPQLETLSDQTIDINLPGSQVSLHSVTEVSSILHVSTHHSAHSLAAGHPPHWHQERGDQSHTGVKVGVSSINAWSTWQVISGNLSIRRIEEQSFFKASRIKLLTVEMCSLLGLQWRSLNTSRYFNWPFPAFKIKWSSSY